MNKVLTAKLGVLIELGTSPLDTWLTFKNELVAAGWQVINESSSETGGYLDIIPPANSPVGNSNGSDVLRFEVTPTTVVMTPGVRKTQPVYSGYQIIPNASVANLQINFGGEVFEVNVPNGDITTKTAYLFNKLNESQVGGVQKYGFALYGDTLAATAKVTNAPPVSLKAGYATITPVVTEYKPNTIILTPQYSKSVNIDLANGFVYYLSITERSVILATKTLTGTFGPIYGTFGDHEAAVKQTPKNCVPIELFVVTMNDKVAGAVWRELASSHLWGSYYGNYNKSLFGVFGNEDMTYLPIKPIKDLKYLPYGDYTVAGATEFRPLNQASTLDQVVWQKAIGGNTGIASYMACGYGQSNSNSYNSQQISFTNLPILTLPDLCTFIGNASDETLQFVKDEDGVSEISSNVEVGDTVFNLNNTANFPTAGYAVASSGEIVKFSGKTDKTLLGITRGQLNTSAQPLPVGASIYPVLWFLKYKTAAIPAGYDRPV